MVVDGIVHDGAPRSTASCGSSHPTWTWPSPSRRRRADTATAAALARTDPVSVAPEDAVADAADLMVRHGVTHLVVVSE